LPSHHDGPPPEQHALGAYIKLMRAAGAVNDRYAALLRAAGLTPSQFGVLEALHFLGPLRQVDLAAKILKSSGNITMVVDHLEQQGLVERERNLEDRRCVSVSLTAAGAKLIAGLYPQVAAQIVQSFTVLTAKEQAQLGDLCKKLGTSLRAGPERGKHA
jgi:MarR family 2-MHQ and catechol resistance regulon transcriptional repressor